METGIQKKSLDLYRFLKDQQKADHDWLGYPA